MPLIQVKLIEGVFAASEKTEIIEKLTDAMVAVEGEAMRAVTWVTIEEVPSGSWGIGGNALKPTTSSRCEASPQLGEEPPPVRLRSPGGRAVTPSTSSADQPAQPMPSRTAA